MHVHAYGFSLTLSLSLLQKHHCPSAPIVLCGTKADLRADPNMTAYLQGRNQRAITGDEGRALAKRIGAVAYVETSAYLMHNVKDVFDSVIYAALNPADLKKKKKAQCALL